MSDWKGHVYEKREIIGGDHLLIFPAKNPLTLTLRHPGEYSITEAVH